MSTTTELRMKPKEKIKSVSKKQESIDRAKKAAVYLEKHCLKSMRYLTPEFRLKYLSFSSKISILVLKALLQEAVMSGSLSKTPEFSVQMICPDVGLNEAAVKRCLLILERESMIKLEVKTHEKNKHKKTYVAEFTDLLKGNFSQSFIEEHQVIFLQNYFFTKLV